jgi:hypothetical protein
LVQGPRRPPRCVANSPSAEVDAHQSKAAPQRAPWPYLGKENDHAAAGNLRASIPSGSSARRQRRGRQARPRRLEDIVRASGWGRPEQAGQEPESERDDELQRDEQSVHESPADAWLDADVDDRPARTPMDEERE